MKTDKILSPRSKVKQSLKTSLKHAAVKRKFAHAYNSPNLAQPRPTSPNLMELTFKWEDSVVLLCKTSTYKAVILQRRRLNARLRNYNNLFFLFFYCRILSFHRLTFLPDAAIGRPYGTMLLNPC